jgi:hypothetical protein
MESLCIRPDAPDQRVSLAADLLARCEGVVVAEGIAILTPRPGWIECAVVEPMPGTRRCEEEFKVMVENAARALRASPLGGRLPDRPLRWIVVEDEGNTTIERWRET